VRMLKDMENVFVVVQVYFQVLEAAARVHTVADVGRTCFMKRLIWRTGQCWVEDDSVTSANTRILYYLPSSKALLAVYGACDDSGMTNSPELQGSNNSQRRTKISHGR
jgi:hypothetical protein